MSKWLLGGRESLVVGDVSPSKLRFAGDRVWRSDVGVVCIVASGESIGVESWTGAPFRGLY